MKTAATSKIAPDGRDGLLDTRITIISRGC
jgi:hypothetical protein